MPPVTRKDITTTTTTNDATAKNIITPEKSINKRPAENPMSYYSYELKDGHNDNHVEGEEEADSFIKEYGDLIVKTLVFLSKEEWLDHQAKRAKILANKPKSSNETTNNSDEANARLIVDSISANTTLNVDRIEAFYKTTSHSTKVVLLLRFLNQQNNDVWIWKPMWMVDIIKNYVKKIKPPEDPVLEEAFLKLEVSQQADPKSKDKEKIHTLSYKPPNSSESYEIQIHTAYTFITIPNEEFNSVEEETTWIVEKATAFLENIRSIMATSTFRLSFAMIKQDFSTKLFDKNKRSNLPKFLSSAVIRVSPVVNLTDHVIQSTAHVITSVFYSNRLPTKKYN